MQLWVVPDPWYNTNPFLRVLIPTPAVAREMEVTDPCPEPGLETDNG